MDTIIKGLRLTPKTKGALERFKADLGLATDEDLISYLLDRELERQTSNINKNGKPISGFWRFVKSVGD